VLDRTPAEPSLRLAALLRDRAKTPASLRSNDPKNHAKESALRAKSLLEELKAPRRLREKVCRIVIRHNEYVPPSPSGVSTLAILEGGDAAFVRDLLTLQHSELSALEFCRPQAEEATLRLEILDELLRGLLSHGRPCGPTSQTLGCRERSFHSRCSARRSKRACRTRHASFDLPQAQMFLKGLKN
ncbi:MAG: hypothetical protein ACLT98_02785, partial [Eggerthellaceae bacterium]